MTNKKRSYSNVSNTTHQHILETTNQNNCSNVGEGLLIVANNSMKFNELGLNDNKIEKLKMVVSMLNKDGQNITIDNLVDRLIDTAFNESVKVVQINKKEVLKGGINSKGSARIKLIHFAEMIKEHNTISEHKFTITQSLLINGFSGKNIDLNLIKSSDKKFFKNGTGCFRKSVKKFMLDNDNFNEYNSKIDPQNKVTFNRGVLKKLTLK